MANPQQVTATWNPNTEPDLAQYFIQWGMKTNGVINFLSTFQISKAQAEATGTPHTWTIIPANLPSAAFPTDGLYWFVMRAVDTSGNQSAQTTPQSKRIVKVSNKIKVRR